MNIEERLKECKTRMWSDANDYNGISEEYIRLSDAITICKDLYTSEQVDELLKKQRENCVDNIVDESHLPYQKIVPAIKELVLNALSPLGEKK